MYDILYDNAGPVNRPEEGARLGISDATESLVVSKLTELDLLYVIPEIARTAASAEWDIGTRSVRSRYRGLRGRRFPSVESR